MIHTRLRVALIFVLGLLACVPALAVQDVIGEILYLDGAVKITRNTESLPGRIDIGFPIQNFDFISVSPGGIAEISLSSRTGFSSTVSIRGGSSVYFDITSFQQTQQGGVELVTGSVGLSVDRMSARSRLQVRTATAVMAVRGTKFEVAVAATGDILLSTEEGQVACETDSGEVFFSQPGQVVEELGGSWAEVQIDAASLSDYRQDWAAARLQSLRANFPRATQNFGNRYLELREDFIDAYVALMSHRNIIQKWIREDRAGTVGSMAEQLREKRQIVGSLLDIRRVLVQWERIFFRIQELQQYYGQGMGEGTVRPGLGFREFFQSVASEQETLSSRLQEIRYILKLYALRNDGRSPLAVFEGGDSFFTNPNDFFQNRN